MPRHPRQGFTLLELAIVMVVIGLLAGAVLTGRDLVKAAEFRKVHKEYEAVVTAVTTFKNKYGCLPGDCLHAEEIFGTDPSCAGGIPPGQPIDVPGVCNGDGDGTLYESSESLMVWKELGLADLIPGHYAGVLGITSPTGLEAGYSCPAVLSEAFCLVMFNERTWSEGGGTLAPGQGITLQPPRGGDYILQLPTNMTAFPLVAGEGIFTPAEALSYDLKFDDGNPAYGNIRSLGQWIADCTTTFDLTAQYDTTKTGKNCTLVYIKSGF